jgi:hypothetical protein
MESRADFNMVMLLSTAGCFTFSTSEREGERVRHLLSASPPAPTGLSNFANRMSNFHGIAAGRPLHPDQVSRGRVTAAGDRRETFRKVFLEVHYLGVVQTLLSGVDRLYIRLDDGQLGLLSLH